LMWRSSGEKDGSHGPTLSQILFTDGTRVTSWVPKFAGTD